jgi:hypothetical protein
MGTNLEQYVTDQNLLNFRFNFKNKISSQYLRITDAFNLFLKFVGDFNTKFVENQTSTLSDSLYFIQSNGLQNLYVRLLDIIRIFGACLFKSE